MTPPTVNAYFDPQMNDINFPAGVLQPPLFDPKMDDAPNYGNTGGTIGHELTHAFDDEGRQFDASGNLKDWWTKKDAKAFEERAQCIVDQYAQYTVVDDIKINSKLTLGEDVADLGGLILGWMAWQDGNGGDAAKGAAAARRVDAGAALLRRLRAVGLRKRSSGKPARERDDGPAFAGALSRQRVDGEYAAVPAGVPVQGGAADGEGEAVSRVVMCRRRSRGGGNPST
jgi:hypothetical protein